MPESFSPYHLRPLASLNRRAVIAVPGIPAELVGRTGAELLSKQALTRLIVERAGELRLGGEDPAEYPRLLNERLAVTGGPGYPAAMEIAEEFGRRLGALLASILLSQGGLTSPLDEWEAAYLDHWRRAVRVFYLGGGHASGKLGEIVRRMAHSVLVHSGLGEREVALAQTPVYLPLIGAARAVPDPAAPGGRAPFAALIFDFGSTRAKRCLAYYDALGALQRVQVFPAMDFTTATAAGQIAALAEAMLQEIVRSLRAVPPDGVLSPNIICSVAAYVENGAPVNNERGVYYRLNHLSPDLKDWFSQRISQSCGRKYSLSFAHDGEMAACALAGRSHSAVIMMGSALGIGFIPPASGLRELAPGFKVVEAPVKTTMQGE